jgi:hypothetical protein
MMNRSKEWLTPLTGVAFVACFVAVFLLFGDGQDATKKSAEEIVTYYKDHDTQQIVGALLAGVASIFLLFFASYLRKVLRDAEGPAGTLSAVAFAGAIVFAAGAAVGASIHFALADLADDTDVVDPVVIQTLNAIDWDYFLFLPVGLGTMILASGISVIRHAALPKWLGWAAIVIVIAFFTPAFPVGLFGAPLWILVVSILLAMRLRNAQAPPSPAAA